MALLLISSELAVPFSIAVEIRHLVIESAEVGIRQVHQARVRRNRNCQPLCIRISLERYASGFRHMRVVAHNVHEEAVTAYCLLCTQGRVPHIALFGFAIGTVWRGLISRSR